MNDQINILDRNWDEGTEYTIALEEIAVAIAGDKEDVTPLSLEERQELGQLEERVFLGLKAYHEAGLALRQILEKKLYREFHPSFFVYCEKKLDTSRRKAYYLIQAAKVVENLCTNCAPQNFTVFPENEGQVRELAKAPTEKQAEVWKRVIETAPNGRITASHVQEVVKAEIVPDPEWASIKDRRMNDAYLKKLNPRLIVGEKVRDWRGDRDLSQEELIRRVNQRLMLIGAIQFPSCQSVISIIESGKRGISLLEGFAIADVLEISIYELSPWKELERRRLSEQNY